VKGLGASVEADPAYATAEKAHDTAKAGKDARRMAGFPKQIIYWSYTKI
jgi:hypothetical protein